MKDAPHKKRKKGDDEIPPNRIRELRNALGLSLERLSELTNLSRNTINTIENSTAELTYTKMRQIAPHLGVKPSGLLLDDDVELRAGPEQRELLGLLEELPSEDRVPTLDAASSIVAAAKRIAGRLSGSPLQGDSDQLARLSGLWNRMDSDMRQRMLGVAEIAGFAEPSSNWRGKDQR